MMLTRVRGRQPAVSVTMDGAKVVQRLEQLETLDLGEQGPQTPVGVR